jgi:putative Mn2+ efflux pump MntP
MVIFSAFLLAVIVSIDTLASGFAYGTSNTKVPFRHIFVLNIICSVTLGLSLFLGLYIGKLFAPKATEIIGAVILISVGTYKLLQYFGKNTSQIPQLQSIIKWRETILLALILSLDGVAVGIGFSIHNSSLGFCFAVIGFSLVTDFLFFIAGNRIGKITKKTRLDLSWLSGVVLIILGAVKFI